MKMKIVLMGEENKEGTAGRNLQNNAYADYAADITHIYQRQKIIGVIM
jgi:hypothetical protein